MIKDQVSLQEIYTVSAGKKKKMWFRISLECKFSLGLLHNVTMWIWRTLKFSLPWVENSGMTSRLLCWNSSLVVVDGVLLVLQ